MFIEAKTDRLRTNLRTYLDHVVTTGDRVVISRHGQEVAALVSLRDFKALTEPLPATAPAQQQRTEWNSTPHPASRVLHKPTRQGGNNHG